MRCYRDNPFVGNLCVISEIWETAFRLPVFLVDVRITPERHLQRDRLEPRVVHFIDLLVSVIAVCEELPDRRGDWIDERDHIPKVDVGYCISVVGLVFLRPMVATSDLELVRFAISSARDT